MQNEIGEMKWRAQASLLSLCLGSAVISAWFFLIPLTGVISAEIFKAFCFGQLLTQLPLLVSRVPGHRAFFLLSLLIIFLGLSYLPASLPVSTLVTVAGAGVLIIAARKLAWPALRACPLILPVFILLSTLAVGDIYGMGSQTPLLLKRVLLNQIHEDTVFHMSIVSMFKTFSIPSTGLDGIPFLEYHTGFHYILSRISCLFDTSSFYVCALWYPCVFLPFFWVTLATCAQSVQRIISPDNEKPGISSWIILLAFLAILSRNLEQKANIWTAAIVFSESLCLSLAFSFIFLALLAYCIEAFQDESPKRRPQIVLLASMVICGFLAAACKVSTAFALCCLSGTVFLLFIKKLSVMHFVAIFIFAAGNLFIALITSPDPIHYLYSVGNFFGDFIQKYGAGMFVFHILFLYLLPLFILFLLQRSRVHARNTRRLKHQDKIILAIAIFMTVCTMLPAYLLDIGNASWYFSTTVRWLLMPFFMAYAASISWPLLTRDMLLRRTHIFKHKGALAATIALTVALLFSAKHAGFDSLGRIIADAIKLQMAWETENASPEGAALLAERSMLVFGLLELQKSPANEKKDTLVYIPQGNEAFWRSNFRNDWLIPALSEHAALESISAKNAYPLYGYDSYPARAKLPEGERSVEYLLEKAKRLGFSKVATWENPDKIIILSAPQPEK